MAGNDIQAALTYELVQTTEGAPNLVLHINGDHAVCPFSPVTPGRDPAGNPCYNRTACNTGCPLAAITHPPVKGGEDKSRTFYRIRCGGSEVTHEVTIKLFEDTRIVPPYSLQ
jgi:hypothetical protein